MSYTNSQAITVNSNAFLNTNGSITFILTGSGNFIPNSMFNGITSLTNITIPNTATTIGTSSFQGCSNLNSITMPNPNTITTVGSNAFSGVQNVFINTDIIPTAMFSGDVSLNTVNFSNNLTTIASNAFNGCTGLTYVNLNNINTINANAFSGCTNLINVVSYPTTLNLANATNVFAPVATTNATIYTNDPNANYLTAYFNTIINQTSFIPIDNSTNYRINNNSLSTTISLYGNTNDFSLSTVNQLFGIPQSTLNPATNPNVVSSSYVPNLPSSLNIQFLLYNMSGLPQYIQFFPNCNSKSSSGQGVTVAGYFSINNNICKIENNVMIGFTYLGYIFESQPETYINTFVNTLY